MPSKLSKRRETPSEGAPGRNQACPCGSGKKYKNCCGGTGGQTKTPSRALVWVVGIGLAIALGVLLTRPAGDADRTLKTSVTGYTERDLPEIDFSTLSESARAELLDEINRLFCTCGCGLRLAECVVTDSTCPVRAANIRKIQAMVKERSGQSRFPKGAFRDLPADG